MSSHCSTESVAIQREGVSANLVAIVGNPNAGKTTLFNSLTGSHQRVGNYPGVTVERVTGVLKLPSGSVDCIDVPGLYSTKAVSEDELVAVQVIKGETNEYPRPDLLVCVVDAGNLERNLFFYSQLAQVGIPIVVALTMVDRISGKGEEIDIPKLSKLLDSPVIPVVGHKEIGLKQLRQAIEESLKDGKAPVVDLGEMPAPNEDGELNLMSREAGARYQWANKIQAQAIKRTRPRAKTLTDKLDLILTHRVFGLIVFIGVMGGVFQSIYTVARPLMDFIQLIFDGIGNAVKPLLSFSPTLQSLITDGLIGGVGSMMVFLPQIMILFLFIAILEGTGYLARAAFLMDRLLGWCGLSGRAFVPLLSSFACAIPGIMAARVMPDAKSRLATILVAPLMSCSARLPVYILLIGAFIQPRYGEFWAGATLYAMHILGMIVAVPIVLFLNRKVIKGKRLPFVLELPPYQWPKWKDVWLTMYFRAKVFVTTAGTIIVLMSVLIWALSYFPRSTEAEQRYRAEFVQQTHQAPNGAAAENYVGRRQLENSYLGRFGQTIEPAFEPAGFDWRVTTSILSAFPARETIVPSLGIIFNLGHVEVRGKHTDLVQALQDARWPDGRPLMTPWTSIGLMVFFALCCQCMSTLATIKRETNSIKWPLFVFSYMTILAYLGAVGINQLGLWLNR